jgi:hypothetical protein
LTVFCLGSMVMAPSAAHSCSFTGCTLAPQESEPEHKQYQNASRPSNRCARSFNPLLQNQIQAHSYGIIRINTPPTPCTALWVGRGGELTLQP